MEIVGDGKGNRDWAIVSIACKHFGGWCHGWPPRRHRRDIHHEMPIHGQICSCRRYRNSFRACRLRYLDRGPRYATDIALLLNESSTKTSDCHAVSIFFHRRDARRRRFVNARSNTGRCTRIYGRDRGRCESGPQNLIPREKTISG